MTSPVRSILIVGGDFFDIIKKILSDNSIDLSLVRFFSRGLMHDHFTLVYEVCPQEVNFKCAMLLFFSMPSSIESSNAKRDERNKKIGSNVVMRSWIFMPLLFHFKGALEVFISYWNKNNHLLLTYIAKKREHWTWSLRLVVIDKNFFDSFADLLNSRYLNCSFQSKKFKSMFHFIKPQNVPQG